jgi:predicted small lipoprotein YifL
MLIKKPGRMVALILVSILLLGLLALAGCGEQGGSPTLPPATIIRSSEQATPTAAPAAEQSQPTSPVAPQAEQTAYPFPAHLGTPGPTATPEVYPTPGQ